jgi:hypothetical protein
MFDRYHSSIMPTIHQTGGYRHSVRKRHRLALSLDEEISRGLVAKTVSGTSPPNYQERPQRLAAESGGTVVQNNTVQQKPMLLRGKMR